MATGDRNDILGRIQALLPRGWFGDSPTILTALLTGFASIYANLYSVLMYARQQLRIATATDSWLDLISFDFFGGALPRGFGQTDAIFRTQIQINLLRHRATRQSIIDILTQLTGHAPIVFEPGRPADTGAYDIGGVGYDAGGGYGDLLVAQSFVTAYRPTGTGIPLISGYDQSAGAYDTASQSEYISDDMYSGPAPDSAIYAAIESVRPVSTIVWTSILNWPPIPIVLPSSYPPPLALIPPPANAVVMSDGSYVVTSDGSYVTHA